MKKIVRNIISAISIIAIVLAPFPQNEVAVASDIVETEIETTEQTESVSELQNVIYNGSFGWTQEGGHSWVADYGTYISLEFSELNSTLTLDVPEYSLPDATVIADISWSRYEYAFDAINKYYCWTWVEDVHDGIASDGTLITAPITGKTMYVCEVSAEGYGTITWEYEIVINTGLTWNNVRPGTDGCPYSQYTVASGSTKTFEAPGYTSNNGGNCTFTWSIYKGDDYVPGIPKYYVSNYSNYEAIEGATGSTYVTHAINKTELYCIQVMDEYGNYIEGFFECRINSGLSWSNMSDSYFEEVSVNLNEQATLTIPDIYIDNGGYTINSWECRGNSNLPAGIVANTEGLRSYTTPAITENVYYDIRVSDDYGNSIVATFFVKINTGLQWSTGETFFIREVNVGSGETATLSLPNIVINDGIDYQIKWQYSGSNHMYEYLDELTGSTSYTTPPVTETQQYYVTVEDDYGNTIDASFTVAIGSGLLWATGENYYYSDVIRVSSGGTTVLQLPEFTIPADEGYTIAWSYSYGMTPETAVDSAADQVTCTTIAITEGTTYSAIITDDYGKSIYATFYLEVGGENTGGSNIRWYDGTAMTSVDYYVTSGESATLILPEISINMGEGYTVSWYHQGEGTIEGANGSVFVTPAIYGYEQYEATVTDNYGYSIYVVFYVRVRTDLSWDEGATGYSKDYYVNYGDSIKLDLPTIHISDGEPYTIIWQWFDLEEMMSEGHVIDEASGQTSYTTFPITGSRNFNVTVKDNYNRCIYANFNVYIENDNTGSGLAWIDWDESWSTEYTVQPNNYAYLSVPGFTINDGFTPTIQWEQEINGEYEVIEGAESETYMTPPMIHSTHFRATVSDNLGTVLYYNVFVNVDSGLEWTGSNYTNITADYGEDKSLTQPPFNIADGLTASYTWYKNDVLIEEENLPVLYLEDITESATYTCEISDGYNTITSYFYVRVNTGLKFSNGTTYYDETIYVLPGEPLNIPVPEYTIDFGTATSQWHIIYGMEPGEMIPGDDDGSLSISDIQKNDTYICVITDSCGNTINAYYYVYVDSGLAWTDGSDNNRTMTEYVNLGESCDIIIPEITYNGDAASELTYEWHLYIPSTFVEELLTDVTGNTYRIDNVQECVKGYVFVNDPYGNRLALYYYVKVDTNLYWLDGSTYGSAYVEVPYGGTFDIWIPEFTINDGVDYKIRVSGPGAGGEVTKDEIVTSGPITSQCIYNITIDDEYNNGISFSVFCRNSYSLAWADGLLYSIQNIYMDDLSDTVTLQLPEYVYDGGKELSITWSGADGTVSDDSRSFTIDGISKQTTVYAKVTDNRYSTIIASFNIGSISTLAFTDGSSQVLIHIAAEAGEPLTLELPEFNNDSPVLYKWSRASKDIATGFKKSAIGTEDTLQISNAEFSSYYYICEITDRTGHTIRAIYDILAPSHDFDSHGVCTLCGEFEAQSLYVSITLDGQIGLNFYVEVDQTDVNGGAYAVLSHGDNSETVMLRDALKGSLVSRSVYKLTYHVDAKEINDLVSLSIYDYSGRPIKMHNASGEEIDSYSFSVAQYLNKVDSTAIATFNNLVTNMSAYGNLAGKYFGTVDSYYVSEDMAAELATCTVQSVQEFAAEESGTMPSGIQYYGSSLVLDSDTNIYHYFKLTDGASIDDYQFFVDGSPVTPVASGSLYRIEINDIPAAELDTAFETVVALAGSTSGYMISYSAYSYVYAALETFDDNTNVDLLNTVRALYLYGNSAKEYFSERYYAS